MRPIPIHKLQQENLDYYQGEHWKYWCGPTLPVGTPNYAEKMAQLERVFQSANLIEECVSNWKNGLISEPFTWYLKGKDGERTEAPEAEKQVQRWLDWVNQQSIGADLKLTNFQQSNPWAEFVLSLGVLGEGNLRLWQPRKFENDSDPVRRYHLHAPKAGSVGLERDDDGFVTEVSYSYGNGKKERQTLLEDGSLQVTIEGDENATEPLIIETGGRWTVHQAQASPLLTKSIKQLQNAVNHSLTMKLRNNELSGFRERVFLNGQAPGEWVDDPSSPGGQKFIPGGELERGPGIDQYVYGIPMGDTMSPSYTTPQIHESQPIPIASFVESIQADRMLMYLAFKQGHLLSAGDAGMSGESRIQLRQNFELELRGWKLPVEGAIADVLNVVLQLLGFAELEAVVSLNITTGKLSAEERKQLIEEMNAGLLSKATAIAKLGSVSDVDAELALIEEERKAQLKTIPVRSTAINQDTQDTMPANQRNQGRQQQQQPAPEQPNQPGQPTAA